MGAARFAKPLTTKDTKLHEGNQETALLLKQWAGVAGRGVLVVADATSECSVACRLLADLRIVESVGGLSVTCHPSI